MTIFHSFGVFGVPSKVHLFMMDVLKRAPEGSATWLLERGGGPGIMKLRENKMYAHEVAAQLIEEKRQELRDGTSRKDVLSLLGSSRAAFRSSIYVLTRSSPLSQGKFRAATRLATER